MLRRTADTVHRVLVLQTVGHDLSGVVVVGLEEVSKRVVFCHAALRCADARSLLVIRVLAKLQLLHGLVVFGSQVVLSFSLFLIRQQVRVLQDLLSEPSLTAFAHFHVSLELFEPGSLVAEHAELFAEDQSCNHADLLDVLGAFKEFQSLHQESFAQWMSLPYF